MRTAKPLVTIWAGLILAFLVLEHYTGFSSDVGAFFHGAGGLTKTLQGRG